MEASNFYFGRGPSAAECPGSQGACGAAQSDGRDVTGDSSTGNSYLYDAEGRVYAVLSEPVPGTYTITGYLYDADGNRIAKGTLTNCNNTNFLTTCSSDPATNGFQLSENYVLGAAGEELSVLDGSNNWQLTNVYAAGKLVGTYDTKGLHYHLEDPLGTRRMQLSGNQFTVGQPEIDMQSLPYGDAFIVSPDPYADVAVDDATPLHFTGKEHDSESGNDYFGARYFASSMAPFLTPDWSAKVEPVPYSKLDDPQSLNLYAYVENEPIVLVDADGHMDCSGTNAKGIGCRYQTAWDVVHGLANPQALNLSAHQLGSQAAAAGKAVEHGIDRGASWFDDHPVVAAGAMLGTSVQADSMAGSVVEEEAETAGTAMEAETEQVGAKVADRIANLTSEAETLYLKKAGKFEMHHIFPKFLGGPENGELSRIPAAYHQLITNEFRTLTKNYNDFSRSADDLMQEVYSKFPLPGR